MKIPTQQIYTQIHLENVKAIKASSRETQIFSLDFENTVVEGHKIPTATKVI